ATCSGVSLQYDEATKTFAGSDGTDAACRQVLVALGQQGLQPNSFGGNFGVGLGCAVVVRNALTEPPDLTVTHWIRDQYPTTSSARWINVNSELTRRACAC